MTLNVNPTAILKTERGEDFKPGHYRVDVSIDGKVVKRLEFDVVPQVLAGGPSPTPSVRSPSPAPLAPPFLELAAGLEAARRLSQTPSVEASPQVRRTQ